MPKRAIYDPEILLEFAQDYLQAEEDFRAFVLEHTSRITGALYPFNRSDEATYFKLDDLGREKWIAFCNACRMVYADHLTVLGTAKAMNRYARHTKWEKCVHLPTWISFSFDYWSGEERTRRFFAKRDYDEHCFRSTGRRKPWTIE